MLVYYFMLYWRLTMTLRGKWNHYIVQQTTSASTMLNALLHLKMLFRMYCIPLCSMPANCGAVTRNLVVWNASKLPTAISNFLYIARNLSARPHHIKCLWGHLVPWLDTVRVILLNDAHLYPAFYLLSSNLMYLTNIKVFPLRNTSTRRWPITIAAAVPCFRV